MEVAGIGRSVGAYKTFAPKNFERALKSESSKDVFSLSDAARDFRAIKSAVNAASDVRDAKVAELREKMAGGSYKVDSAAIAEKIACAGLLF